MSSGCPRCARDKGSFQERDREGRRDERSRRAWAGEGGISGDGSVIRAALPEAARSVGVKDLARAAGLSRVRLYTALLPQGNPQLSTLTAITRVFGLKRRLD